LAKGGLEIPTGPNPLDFCGVAFRIFHQGRLVGEALQEFSSGFLKASDRQGAVLLGPNRFNWDEKSDPPSYIVTVQAPLRGGKKLLRARLFFTPLNPQTTTLPQPEMPSTHTWVLAAPRCHVEGTFQWVNAEGESEKEQAFVGRGYHDHHFGSVPLDRFVKAWHWGRAFLGDETLVYSVQVPVDPAEPTDGLLLIAHPKETLAWKTAWTLSKKRRNFFLLPYQKEFGFTDTHSLKINHEEILSDGPVSLVFKDRVEWSKEGKVLTGPGMSNYLFTPRLSSRFFFPMLKGKTTVLTQKEEPKLSNLNKPGGDVFTDRPD
jgi:carotenoid 1,2-hydratase